MIHFANTIPDKDKLNEVVDKRFIRVLETGLYKITLKYRNNREVYCDYVNEQKALKDYNSIKIKN